MPPPHSVPRIINLLRAPNFLVGRGTYEIKYFIRHNTESKGVGPVPSLSWFLNPRSGVSCHHLIGRNGTRYDLVYRTDTAYHCGSAAWGEDKGSVKIGLVRVGKMNVLSLGMEFESNSTNANAGTGYTEEQLWTGAYTEACSLASYNGLIVLDHKEIALPAGRRFDPSHFPYPIYLDYVRAWLDFLRAQPDDEKGKWCL